MINSFIIERTSWRICWLMCLVLVLEISSVDAAEVAHCAVKGGRFDIDGHTANQQTIWDILHLPTKLTVAENNTKSYVDNYVYKEYEDYEGDDEFDEEDAPTATFTLMPLPSSSSSALALPEVCAGAFYYDVGLSCAPCQTPTISAAGNCDIPLDVISCDGTSTVRCSVCRNGFFHTGNGVCNRCQTGAIASAGNCANSGSVTHCEGSNGLSHVVCSSCLTGFHPTVTGGCSTCNTARLIHFGHCSDSVTSCDGLDGTTNTICQTVQQGYYRTSTLVANTCHDPILGPRSCSSSANVLTCTGPTGLTGITCTACNPPNYDPSGGCKSNCQTNAIALTGKCSSSTDVSSCLTSTSNILCTSCIANYYLTNIPGTCQTCQTQPIARVAGCSDFSAVTNCASPTTGITCSSCEAGRFLQSGGACQTCKTPTAAANGNCLSDRSVATCTSESSHITCSACTSGFTLVRGECIQQAQGPGIYEGLPGQSCDEVCTAQAGTTGGSKNQCQQDWFENVFALPQVTYLAAQKAQPSVVCDVFVPVLSAVGPSVSTTPTQGNSGTACLYNPRSISYPNGVSNPPAAAAPPPTCQASAPNIRRFCCCTSSSGDIESECGVPSDWAIAPSGKSCRQQCLPTSNTVGFSSCSLTQQSAANDSERVFQLAYQLKGMFCTNPIGVNNDASAPLVSSQRLINIMGTLTCNWNIGGVSSCTSIANAASARICCCNNNNADVGRCYPYNGPLIDYAQAPRDPNPSRDWVIGSPGKSCDAVCTTARGPNTCNTPLTASLNSVTKFQAVASSLSLLCSSYLQLPTLETYGAGVLTSLDSTATVRNDVCQYPAGTNVQCSSGSPRSQLICCCGQNCPVS